MASGVHPEQKARAQEDAHPQRSDPADSAARGLSGEPGAKTLWLGLQEIAIFVEGARYAREFSEAGTCV